MNELNDPSWPSSFFSREIPEFEEYASTLKEKINNLPSATRLTDHEIELIYSVAYSFFQQGKTEKAHAIFQVLVFYRPTDQRLLNAVAISYKKLGDYENAYLNFLLLFFFNPNELKFAQHSAECLAAIGEKERALELVENILQSQSIEFPENKLVKSRAEILKKMLIKGDHAPKEILH